MAVKRLIIKGLRVLGLITISLVSLVILLCLAIQIPFIQNKITQEAIRILKEKIHTEVRLDHVTISFPKDVVLKGLYFEDQSNDTLLFVGELAIRADLMALFQHRVYLNKVRVENLTAFVYRNANDSTFNFDYILAAFGGDSTASEDETSTPWDFKVSLLELTDAHVALDDRVEGNNVIARLHSLNVDVDDFDLNESRLNIKNIELSTADINIIQKTNSSTADTASNSNSEPLFDFDVKNIRVSESTINYKDGGTGRQFRCDFGEFILASERIDLNHREVQLKSVKLSNSFISYQQHADPSTNMMGESEKENQSSNQPPVESPWHIAASALTLANNGVQYFDFNAPAKNRAIDFNHLWITGLNVQAKDLDVNGSILAATLDNLSLHEHSGFEINSLRTSLLVTDTTASLKDFVFQSPQSRVALDARFQFLSLSSLDANYENTTLSVVIDRSVLSVKDIKYIDPAILDSIPLTIPGDAAIEIETTFNGSVNNLSIENLWLSVLNGTTLQTSGNIVGLPGRHASMDMKLDSFHTSKVDLIMILPDSMTSSIELPEWIGISGTIQGYIDAPRLNSTINSDFGAIELTGEMDSNSRSATSTYTADLKITKFKLGQLLKNATLGSLSMTASVDGSGLSMHELNTRLDTHITNFDYQGYTYKDFKIRGTLSNYLFEGKASLEDKNLTFDFDGNLNFNKDIPEYAFTFQLKNADLQALHLSSRPLKARGTLDAKFSTSDFKIINGDLDIRDVAIYNGEALYRVDSLLFASIDQEGETNVSIRSDIVSGDFVGTLNIFSVSEALKRHFNSYFSLHDRAYDKSVDPQNFKFNLVLKNTDLLTEIILPKLNPFVPGKIEGSFNSANHQLNLRFDIASIDYNGIGMDSLRFRVGSDKNSMNYSLTMRKIKLDTLVMEAMEIKGKIANDSVRTKVVILDSLQKEKYVLGGVFYSLEKEFQFHFLPNELIINRTPWKTPADNSLKFTNDRILAHHFEISNHREKISIVSYEGGDTTTTIHVNDLNLRDITSITEGSIWAEGFVNGKFDFVKQGFHSNFSIRDLEVAAQPWGDLSLKLDQVQNGGYSIDLQVSGDKARIQVTGNYLMDSVSSDIEAVANLSRLDLSLIQPFVGEKIESVKGNLTGKIEIRNHGNKPKITGSLAFKDASFKLPFTNAAFFLKDEPISFTNEGIILKNFKILDERNNVADVSGTIKTESFEAFNLNLTLAAKNFQLLNSTEKDNDLVYGKVGINTTARITGDLQQPNIQMNVSLNDDSDLTYIIPQSEKGILEQKGIVVFIDKDAKNDPFLAAINPRDTVKSSFTGVDLTANIELDDKETFSIVIDPLTGDKLTAKGNSTLTLEIDPSGNIQLAGRYEISEGSYDLTFYKLVKRKFLIEKGSSILWSGDPMDATMDIRAIFEVEASPLELISNQIVTNNAQELNSYKQRLPFLVYLNIKGNLLSPEISFELDMPEDKRNAFGGAVYATIKDINSRESDLNKQVFALLILRRFISDNIFDNQSASTVSNTARRSVSRLLTEQLNRLTENIKGVELSFDVKSYEDYTEGQAQGETKLQLGVSKSLLDDRLVVKVSGNVDIEGSNNTSQNSLTDYIGDLALEYKLTPDGRFRITGFRNSNYDIIDGELIETGGGLIYIKDYNSLRELFNANAAEK